MFTIKVRKCANEACGSLFIKKHKRHQYCSRKCFKTTYMKKLKQHEINGFPLFICPRCKGKIQLDFFPKQNNEKWQKLGCPFCDYKRIDI